MTTSYIPAGVKVLVHVNQHLIKANAKDGTQHPVFTVKVGGKNHYAERVDIHGGGSFVYYPDDPLSCGAKVWFETDGGVTLINPTTYGEIHAKKPTEETDVSGS